MLGSVPQQLVQFIDIPLNLMPHFGLSASFHPCLGRSPLTGDGVLQTGNLPVAEIILLHESLVLTEPDLVLCGQSLDLFRIRFGLLTGLFRLLLIFLHDPHEFLFHGLHVDLLGLIVLCQLDEGVLHHEHHAVSTGQFLPDYTVFRQHAADEIFLLILVGLGGRLVLQPLVGHNLAHHVGILGEFQFLLQSVDLGS